MHHHKVHLHTDAKYLQSNAHKPIYLFNVKNAIVIYVNQCDYHTMQKKYKGKTNDTDHKKSIPISNITISQIPDKEQRF